jgi:hypothetical protein
VQGHDVTGLLATLRSVRMPASYIGDRERAWVPLQHEVRAAAEAHPEQEEALAAALLEACACDHGTGEENPLELEVAAWAVQAASSTARRYVEEAAKEHGVRWILERIWDLPGDAGARWLPALARHHNISAGFWAQDMHAGHGRVWRPEDWPARLHALADADLRPMPNVVQYLNVSCYQASGEGKPPRIATAGLCRLAVLYGESPTEWVFRRFAEVVRGSRTGRVKDDLELFWWPDGERAPELFRWFLELAGEPDARQPLVAAAQDMGLISAETATYLRALLDRPAWVDGPVPWVVAEVLSAGSVDLPDGTLVGGDAIWLSEGAPWSLTVPVGSHPAYVVLADHPLAPRSCAALGIRLLPDRHPERWELVPGKHEPHGYTILNGVAALGPSTIISDEQSVAWDPEPLFHPGNFAEIQLVDGRFVVAAVSHQHAPCRTWAGYAANDELVEVFTEFDLLEVDPPESGLPWPTPRSPGVGPG